VRARHLSDRLLPFTDAVVAIAITLLILPLVEIGQDAQRKVGFGDFARLFEVLRGSTAPLIGFTISFFVIARLWWAHHAIFEHAEAWTAGMVVTNVFWLFTIVLLPWVTTLSTTFLGNWLVSLLYVGTMTLSSAMQTVLARLVVRSLPTPEIGALERYYGNLTTLIAFGLALALCVAFPLSFYTPLLLLAFTGLIDRQMHRRLASRIPTAIE
jgi:uncharacterized membrane protein